MPVGDRPTDGTANACLATLKPLVRLPGALVFSDSLGAFVGGWIRVCCSKAWPWMQFLAMSRHGDHSVSG